MDALHFRLKDNFGTVDLELFEKETLFAFISDEKLKFSFFLLPYAFLSPLTFHEVQTGILCPMASLDDIEAMKAVALAQRGSAKDFIDLFFLLRKTGHSFDDLAGRVQTKYGVNEKYSYHLKTSMVYFDDAEPELNAIQLVGEKGRTRSVSAGEWNDIKRFFLEFCR